MRTHLNYVQPVIGDLAELLPGCDRALLNLYALLAMTRGVNTSLEDVHDAWAIWRNADAPQHRSLVPFDELTVEVQELDRKYMEAIHSAAAAQHERREQGLTDNRPKVIEGERPWCGASRELGGQQPCPIKTPCEPGTCRIGDEDGAE